MTKLPKKAFAALRNDNPDALLELIGQSDPESLLIGHNPLLAACATAGAERCALAVLAAYPNQAKALAQAPDSLGRQPLWVCAQRGLQTLSAALLEAAPECAGAACADGAYPLEAALKHARWAIAGLILDKAEPGHAALASDSFGRNALHMAAEPSMEAFGDDKSLWTPPPEDLLLRLIASGADPCAKNNNGYTPLDCAAVSGTEPCAIMLLEALKSSPQGQETLPYLLSRQPAAHKQLGLLHHCAKKGYERLASELLASGADPLEPTDRQSLAASIALSNGHCGLARVLLEAGKKAEIERAGEKPSILKPVAFGALFSPDFAAACKTLRDAGYSVYGREANGGTGSCELAWETLGFADAKAFWLAAPDSAKEPGNDTLFGALERAARSQIDPEAKILWLISQGQKPAALKGIGLDKALDQGLLHRSRRWPRPNAQLSSYWVESPAGPAQGPDNSQAPGQFDDLDPPASRQKLIRPSLPAYCAATGRHALLPFLLRELTEKQGIYGAEDWAAALAAALKAKAPSKVLAELIAACKALGADPGAEPLCSLANEHLGPLSLKKLGFARRGADQDIETLAAKAPAEAFGLEIDRYRSSRNPSFVPVWDSASKNLGPAALKAAVPDDAKWPAAGLLRFALACSSQPKPSAQDLQRVLDRARQSAACGAKNSWQGQAEPGLLWPEAVRSECALFLAQRPECAPPSPAGSVRRKETSGYDQFLANALRTPECKLWLADNLPALAAPEDPGLFAEVLAQHLAQACAFGARSQENKEALRTLCAAAVDVPSWKSALAAHSDKLLACCADQPVFDLIYSQMPPAPATKNKALLELAKTCCGKINPSLAEKIAACLDPEHKADAAVAFCSTSLGQEGSDSSAVTVRRALRAAAQCPPEQLERRAGRFAEDPVAQAMLTGNAAAGLALVDWSRGKLPKAGAVWQSCAGALWLAGKAPFLRDMLQDRRFSQDPDEFLGVSCGAAADGADPSEGSALRAGKLEDFRAQFDRLGEAGLAFGGHAQADSWAASALCAAHLPGPLAWALQRGLRPGLIDASQTEHISAALDWRTQEALESYSSLPPIALLFLAPAYARAPFDILGKAAAEWKFAGLPMECIPKEPGAPAKHVEELMDPSVKSAYDAAVLRRQIGEQTSKPKARAL